MKKMIMLVVALFLTAGVAFADGNMGSKGTTKCGDSKKEIKSDAHMNSNNMGSQGTTKCGDSKKETMNKNMPLKEMKKVGSCGTGKCGDSK